MGSIPPMSSEEWERVFSEYKKIPEYKIEKPHLDLDGFKLIFFWEYFHRLFARVIGLVFFFPLVYLAIKKRLSNLWFKRLGLAFCLGGLQGAVGWFMVRSGLSERVDVSHYRLALHFGLALFILAYLYWLSFKIRPIKKLELGPRYKKSFHFFLAILCVQLIYGAFVAGIDAGIGFNTFPKMGKHWLPPGLFHLNLFDFLFESNVSLQFIHRYLGVGLFLWGSTLSLKLLLIDKRVDLRKILFPFALALSAQFFLGVWVIVSRVPMELASAHQMLATFLLLATLRIVYTQNGVGIRRA